MRELETVIANDLEGWVRVGMALIEVRDQKLFRETHETLEAWAKARFELGKSRIYQLISGVQTRDNISVHLGGLHVPLPTNERQIRELSQCEPEEQAEIWTEAVALAPSDEEVSDKHVKQALRDRKRAAEPAKPEPPGGSTR